METKKYSLEEELEKGFNELNITPEKRERFMPYLELLKIKDKETYEHSIRVGLLGKQIAEYRHDDAKALFLPGIVHDVGKLLIDSEVLKKKQGFNLEDKKIMDEHPVYGYKLLEGIAPFSALVSYYHHYFGEKGYPRNNTSPTVNISFSEDTLHWAKECSRLVAIADFWDAATHRVNDKFNSETPKLLTKEEALEILLKNGGCRTHLINEMYKDGILR